MLDKPFPFAARRKPDAPPLVDAEGVPLATTPEPRTWCRLAVSISLVPPKQGRVFSIESGPWTRRGVMYAPRFVMWTLFIATLGQVPWIKDLALWLFTHWK